MKSPARRAATETEGFEQVLYATPTRRELLRTFGLAILAADTLGGYLAERQMTSSPEAKVYLNPDSDQTIITMGGWANDGIALGDQLAPVFGQYASVIAIRYAETEIDPVALHDVIFGTMEEHGLHNPSFYLNSGAGLYGAYAIHRHAGDPASQAKFGRTRVVELHDSPSSEHDMVLASRVEMLSRADLVAKYSRLLNLALKVTLNVVLPGAEYRDPSLVSAEGAGNQHAAMKRTDLITAVTEIEAIRSINLPPGYLKGAADHFVCIHPASADEQLVVPELSVAGWRRICGEVRDVLDTNAPAGPSHATSTFPRTLDNIFREYLPIPA